MTSNEKKIALIVGLCIILMYVIAGLFCHPCGDDFSYAILGKNENLLKAVMNERLVWNGRYFSNFLVFLSPLNFGGLIAYKLSPFIIILFILIGTYFFYKKIGLKNSFILSILSLLISFSIMPDITEGIYWYTGAITYIPGFVIFLVGCSLLLNLPEKLKLGYYFLIVILFVVSSGFNEIIPLLGIATFSCLFFSSRKKSYLLYAILFVCLFTYMFTAPGNEIRGSYFKEKHQLFKSFGLSSAYTIRFVGEWLLNPAFLFWGLFLTKLDHKKKSILKLNYLQNPFVVVLVFFGPTFICCFGPIWSTGLLGQYRTANLASYIFVISYTLIIISNKEYLTKNFKFIKKFKYGFVGLLIFICIWKNQFFLVKELINGEITGFNREMYDRYDLIKECGKDDCYLPTIKNKSEILFVYPLVDNPKNWQNETYQKFFNSGMIYKSD